MWTHAFIQKVFTEHLHHVPGVFKVPGRQEETEHTNLTITHTHGDGPCCAGDPSQGHRSLAPVGGLGNASLNKLPGPPPRKDIRQT